MSNTEKRSELAVRSWLETTYAGVSRPSPDPPDYLVDGRFAVEVTEVHQVVGDSHEKSITDPVQRTAFAVFADKFPKPSLGRLLVDIEYSLELPPLKKSLQVELSEALRDFTDEDRSVPRFPSERLYWNRRRHFGKYPGNLHVCLRCGLCVNFLPLSGSPEFVLNSCGPDCGVFPLSELIYSAQQIIPRKTCKASRVARRYSSCQWWLVLVDAVGHPDLRPWEVADFSRSVTVPSFWQRVLFFDMAFRCHELLPSSRFSVLR